MEPTVRIEFQAYLNRWSMTVFNGTFNEYYFFYDTDVVPE